MWSQRVTGKRKPCRLRWVSQLIDPVRMVWKEEMVRDVFWPHDAEYILNIRLPTRPAEDFVAWSYERTGVYSVRSAYRLAKDLKDVQEGGRQSTSRVQSGQPLWTAYWKLPIPHKILIFGWRAVHNGLATMTNKRGKRIEATSTCKICSLEDETIMHALVKCPMQVP